MANSDPVSTGRGRATLLLLGAAPIHEVQELWAAALFVVGGRAVICSWNHARFEVCERVSEAIEAVDGMNRMRELELALQR